MQGELEVEVRVTGTTYLLSVITGDFFFITGVAQVFQSLDSDPSLAKSLDSQTPVTSSLELKVGTQVMLTKNMDVTRGLVNGARGVITGFKNGGEGKRNREEEGWSRNEGVREEERKDLNFIIIGRHMPGGTSSAQLLTSPLWISSHTHPSQPQCTSQYES